MLVVGLNYAPETTGIAPYTSGLAEGLARRGHAVRVLTTHPHYPQWRVQEGYGQWASETTAGGVRVRRLRHFVPDGRRAVARLLSEVSFGLRVVAQRWGRPDVIVMVSPALFANQLVTARARWIERAPSVLWIQDLYGLGVTETGQAGGAAAQFVARVEAVTTAAQTRVVAIHDRFASTIAAMPGVRPESVRVVRNWSHVDETPPFDRPAMRARFGWRPDETVVLHAGNQGVKQGLENVLAAAKLAEERGAPVRFVLLGDGNQRERLEREARGVSTIAFVDPLPGAEFTQAMGAADVLLVNELPGVEGMAVPSKLTSYFASGRPVLAATDAGSTTASEINASGGGMRVEPGDPEALLEGARRLASDLTLATVLGTAGRRYRTEVLGADAAIASFEHVLTEAVRGGGHRAPEAPVP